MPVNYKNQLTIPGPWDKNICIAATVWFDHGRGDGIARERERVPDDISQVVNKC